ncbi:MAG: hypothetical protein ACTSXL_02970 [Alphaproteobacteria bacterium]
MNKKKNFDAKAQTILDPKKKNIGGLGDFLKDDDIKEDNKEKLPPQNTEILKYDNPEKNTFQKGALESQQSIIVRHELHIEEDLSEKIRAFQFFNKEKNKTRFLKIVLNEFFSKSEDQQKRIYQKWLKKI